MGQKSMVGPHEEASISMSPEGKKVVEMISGVVLCSTVYKIRGIFFTKSLDLFFQ